MILTMRQKEVVMVLDRQVFSEDRCQKFVDDVFKSRNRLRLGLMNSGFIDSRGLVQPHQKEVDSELKF